MVAFDLRPYQKECVELSLDAYGKYTKDKTQSDTGILYLATGTGKTVIASEIIKRLDKKVLVIVHREELISQTIKKLISTIPYVDVGIVKQKWNELGRKITIAGIQSIISEKRLNEINENGPYDLVIVDEFHHFCGNIWADTVKKIDGFKIGLTATPNNLPEEYSGKILYRFSIFEAIKYGYLCDIKGIRCNYEIDLKKVGVSKGDFKEGALSKEMSKPECIQFTYETWLHYSFDKKTVIFCVNIDHCIKVYDYFTEKGVEVAYIIGDTKTQERNQIYKDFQDGKIKVLLAVMVLTEGWDFPQLECVIMARPTLSETVYIQSAGRCLRPSPGKDKALIIDLVGNSKKHQLIQLGILIGRKPKNVKKGKKKEIDPLAIVMPEEPELPNEIDSVMKLIRTEENMSMVDVSQERKFAWVELDGSKFALTLGGDKYGFFLIERQGNDFNCWVLKHYYSKGWRDVIDVISKELPFDWAISIAEKEAERLLMDVKTQFVDNNASWRTGSATPNQIQMLKELGCNDIPKTKGQASDLINKVKVTKMLDMYEIAIKTPIGKHTVDVICRLNDNKDLKVNLGDFDPNKITLSEAERIKRFHRFHKAKAV